MSRSIPLEGGGGGHSLIWPILVGDAEQDRVFRVRGAGGGGGGGGGTPLFGLYVYWYGMLNRIWFSRCGGERTGYTISLLSVLKKVSF